MTVIGSSELDALPVALGTNTFGWTADREQSFAILDAFTAAGGSLVDTADSYSAWVPGNAGGVSETIIGEWIETARVAAVEAHGRRADRGGDPARAGGAADRGRDAGAG